MQHPSGSGPTWRLRGAVDPASAWGQGSAPISPLTRSGKCWRITRGEPHLPPRAPCWTTGAALTLVRDHTQTAPGDAGVGKRRFRSDQPATLLPTLTCRFVHTFLYYHDLNLATNSLNNPSWYHETNLKILCHYCYV